MKSFKAIVESNYSKNYPSEKNDLTPLRDRLEKHYTGYNQEEQTWLNGYTSSSKTINSHHWKIHKGEEISPTAKEKIEYRTSYIDSALAKHKTPHPLTVFSGMRSDPRERKDEKGIVYHPAYLSTSVNKSIAKDFGRHDDDHGNQISHILRIRVPKGHPGAYVDHFSQSAGEHEFLLPRGLKLKHVYTQEHKIGKFEKIYEHHMEIVK